MSTRQRSHFHSHRPYLAHQVLQGHHLVGHISHAPSANPNTGVQDFCTGFSKAEAAHAAFLGFLVACHEMLVELVCFGAVSSVSSQYWIQNSSVFENCLHLLNAGL